MFGFGNDITKILMMHSGGGLFTAEFNVWYDYGTSQGYAPLSDAQKLEVNAVFIVLAAVNAFTKIEWFYLPMLEDGDRATLNLIDPTLWQNVYFGVADHIPNFGYISLIANNANYVSNGYNFQTDGVVVTTNTDNSYGAVSATTSYGTTSGGSLQGMTALGNSIVIRNNNSNWNKLWSSGWIGSGTDGIHRRLGQVHKTASQDWTYYANGGSASSTAASDVALQSRDAVFCKAGNTGVDVMVGVSFYGVSFTTDAQTLETAIDTYVTNVMISEDLANVYREEKLNGYALPNPIQIVAQDNLLGNLNVGLVNAEDVWSELDMLRLFANANDDITTVDYKDPTMTFGVITGTVTLDVDEGLYGTGIQTSYYGSQWIASTDAVNYASEDMSVGYYKRSVITTHGGNYSGGYQARLTAMDIVMGYRVSSGKFEFAGQNALNSFKAVVVANVADKLYSAGRGGDYAAGRFRGYEDDVLIGHNSPASIGLPTEQAKSCYGTDETIGLIYSGAALTHNQYEDFKAAITQYYIDLAL